MPSSPRSTSEKRSSAATHSSSSSSKPSKRTKLTEEESQSSPSEEPPVPELATLAEGEYPALATLEEARKAFPRAVRDTFDVATAKFKEPSAIQARTWGPLLKGADVVGVAATGSGKTLAFVLPAVARLRLHRDKSEDDDVKGHKDSTKPPHILVLSPTRELCMQIYEVAKAACEGSGIKVRVAYGGQSRGEQKRLLDKGADFVVATPGRLLDFADSGDLKLDRVGFLVLDEADRMLDMGFERDMRKIVEFLPKERQTVMFSATWPDSIKRIASEFLKADAVKVALSGTKLKAATTITQSVEVMGPMDKDKRLFEILDRETRQGNAKRVIIFALYKKEAERLEQTVSRVLRGRKVAGVHGDKSQPERERAVAAFASGEASILVATDVAARGLDIKGVDLVINYTFPLTIEDYVHRVGRTGRAGATGTAITFFTEHDKAHSGELQNVLREAGVPIPPELAKFGSTVKKKTHELYGAHYKKVDPDLANSKPSKITFDSDDE